ncbi:hypothetical protein [Kribbella deserti]|uniref:Uncharacterized protein n=1 Tax=Kribbella deserti TaxID=1926257 RepID=A0ABV6QZR7_9ACTN
MSRPGWLTPLNSPRSQSAATLDHPKHSPLIRRYSGADPPLSGRIRRFGDNNSRLAVIASSLPPTAS